MNISSIFAAVVVEEVSISWFLDMLHSSLVFHHSMFQFRVLMFYIFLFQIITQESPIEKPYTFKNISIRVYKNLSLKTLRSIKIRNVYESPQPIFQQPKRIQKI